MYFSYVSTAGATRERAELHFWLREVGGAGAHRRLLLWGASGKLVIHKRKLSTPRLRAQLKQILTEMGGCGGGGQGGDGGGGSRQDASGGDVETAVIMTPVAGVLVAEAALTVRAARSTLAHGARWATKLLVTYRRESALGFRPPTTKSSRRLSTRHSRNWTCK